jgi:hypothetical protein
MLTGMGTHHFHPHAAAFSPSGKTGLRHNTKILALCLVCWILCKNNISNTINHKTNKYFHFWILWCQGNSAFAERSETVRGRPMPARRDAPVGAGGLDVDGPAGVPLPPGQAFSFVTQRQSDAGREDAPLQRHGNRWAAVGGSGRRQLCAGQAVLQIFSQFRRGSVVPVDWGKQQANATHQGRLAAYGPIGQHWQLQGQRCQGRPGKALSPCLGDKMGFDGFHQQG